MRAVPPDCWASPYTWLRPSPVPFPTSLVVKKGSNALARVSAAMPSPLSVTETRTYSPTRSSGGRSRAPAGIFLVAITTRPPNGMASRALMERLRMATSICVASTRAGQRDGARHCSEFNPVLTDRAPEHLGHPAHGSIQVGRFCGENLPAREGQELLGELRAAPRRTVCRLDQLQQWLVPQPSFEQF